MNWNLIKWLLKILQNGSIQGTLFWDKSVGPYQDYPTMSGFGITLINEAKPGTPMVLPGTQFNWSGPAVQLPGNVVWSRPFTISSIPMGFITPNKYKFKTFSAPENPNCPEGSMTAAGAPVFAAKPFEASLVLGNGTATGASFFAQGV